MFAVSRPDCIPYPCLPPSTVVLKIREKETIEKRCVRSSFSVHDEFSFQIESGGAARDLVWCEGPKMFIMIISIVRNPMNTDTRNKVYTYRDRLKKFYVLLSSITQAVPDRNTRNLGKGI